MVTLSPSFVVANLSCTISSLYTCVYHSNSSGITANKTVGAIITASTKSFTITGFLNPITWAANITSSIRGYSANNYLVNQYIGSLLSWSPICNYPCMTCSTNKSSCLSCFSNSSITNYPYYYAIQEICLAVCYSTQVLLTNQCVDCTNNCMECKGSTSNCSACNTSTTYAYYFNFTCVKSSQCPQNFYADPSFNCLACFFPCKTCTSATQCLSCAIGAYWYQSNCISSCPFAFTITNSVNQTCDVCDPICATCSIAASNCTTCGVGTVQFNNSCLNNCTYPLYILLSQCV